jgi:hypothetical protein
MRDIFMSYPRTCARRVYFGESFLSPSLCIVESYEA